MTARGSGLSDRSRLPALYETYVDPIRDLGRPSVEAASSDLYPVAFAHARGEALVQHPLVAVVGPSEYATLAGTSTFSIERLPPLLPERLTTITSPTGGRAP